jgi:hypothetical protein
VARAREFGDQGIVASMRHNQAYLALHQNDSARAKALLTESLVISRDLELKDQLAWAFAGMGGVAAAQSQPKRATRLLGAAEAWFEATSQIIGPIERAEHDGYAASARAQLGEEAFAAAWAEGRAMTMEQAIAYALGG